MNERRPIGGRKVSASSAVSSVAQDAQSPAGDLSHVGGEPAIRVAGLVKTYGPIRALDGLDLEVRQGVVYGFLGPNGAGKTTTMRI
jgi:ABC-type glutathione transport system ATPase component